mmetsp:Transcript_20508/g.30827  ORF Transcript_20508/g.30827 Transcript_20508/m.30827 type:complete len:283 (-) Transcript_20508:1630-2478(-)
MQPFGKPVQSNRALLAKQESSRASVSSEHSQSKATVTSVESAATVFHSDLTRESMDFDRRQIRRQIEDKIRASGKNPEDEIADEEWDDAETIYEDQEAFPWKQREAAVQAAAMGGKTESRMEGYDSLERAIQAHEHQLIYGRGRAFGWTAQKKNGSSSLVSSVLEKQKLKSMQFLTTWASFKNIDEAEELSVLTRGKSEVKLDPEQQDKVDQRKNNRYKRMRDILYLLIAVGTLIGFAVYLESAKASNYDVYIPQSEIPEDNIIVRDRTLRKQQLEYPNQLP